MHLCKERNFRTYSYTTANQQQSAHLCSSFALKFTTLMFFFSPDALLFKQENEAGSISVQCIERIEVRECNCVYTIFNIVCRSKPETEVEEKLTIIASL